jgi:hypothetical protein
MTSDAADQADSLAGYDATSMHATSYHYPSADAATISTERVCGDCVKPEHAAWWEAAQAENEREAGL